MKRFAFLAIPFAFAACGDNNPVVQPVDAPPVDIDAQDIDARVIDAREIDTPPAPTYTGSVTFLETQLLNPGTSGTFFGQGIQFAAAFNDAANVQAPELQEDPASALGCKAWVYDTPAEIAANVAAGIGVNEGDMRIESPIGTRLFPDCTFVPGAGYTCLETTTAQVGGTIGPGPMPGLFTFTDLDTTFSDANSAGRYLKISGSASNNGAFPIVGVAAVPPATTSNTVVFASSTGVAEVLPAAAQHINIAGVGPTPSKADPGFLADDATLLIHRNAGTHLAEAMQMTNAAGVGDDFALAAADLQLLNALPRTGAAITIGCDPASCAAQSASGMLVNIVTTNAPTTGLSPFAMPVPEATQANGKRVQVRCSMLGVNSITIPAAYSAFIMNSGATRIQTTVIRPSLMAIAPVSVISGHAIVGFTN